MSGSIRDGGVDAGTSFCELGKAIAVLEARGVRARVRVLVGRIGAVDLVGDFTFCESNNGTEKRERVETLLRDIFAATSIPIPTILTWSWAWSRGSAIIYRP